MWPLPSTGVLLSPASTVLWATPTPAPRSPISRAHRLYGSPLPVHTRVGTSGVSLLGRRRGSPVPTLAVPPFRTPYAAGFLRVAPPSSSPRPRPSPITTGLGSLLASCAGKVLDAAGFTSCCGPMGCTPPLRRLDPTLRRPGLPERRRAATKAAWSLLRPVFHRQVSVSFAGRNGTHFRETGNRLAAYST